MKLHKNFLFCLFAALALALLCLFALPQTAHAANERYLTFTRNATGDGYTVDYCSSFAYGELVIPSTYNGLPVTGIDENAFEGCYDLTSVTIPDGVTYIGNFAFYCCVSLTSITIPDSVTSIGDCAFNCCRSLISITIPASVTSIGNCVFSLCESLTSIKVDASNAVYHSAGNCIIETASKTLIAGCKTSQIPTNGSVTTIGTSSFSNCKGLTSITIPNSVTSIGDEAFYECTGLTSVHIPDSVTAIGNYAFFWCTGLTSVTYCGTEEQWETIEIASKNDPLTNAVLQLHDMENGSCTICEQKGHAAGDLDGIEGVDHNDAVYLLLHTMFGEAAYPLNGADADIDGNGTVNQDDAVYLLLHTMFGEAFYPISTKK